MYITDDNAIDVVNQLFDKLTLIKPAFKQAWPTEQDFHLAKREWVIAFQQANINSIEQLRRAIDYFRLSEKNFIPSPGEFIGMCKATPKDVKAPSVQDAYLEACKNSYPDGLEKKWSHPCVRYATQKADSFFMRTAARQKSFPVFEQYYLDAVDQFSQGKIMDQIEHHRKDTTENRIKYQEEWGGTKENRPHYFDWLNTI